MDEHAAIILGDPKRQATASFRGYAYQVARTLLAWFELSLGDVIIVEGAEDFDRLGRADELHQIKTSATNITLRNADVRDAIQNFFNTQERNKNRKFTMRFMTTSLVGTERGDPFSQPGITLWNALRSEPDELRREAGTRAVANFIVETDAFSSELREYCRTEPWLDVFHRIIEPLYFDVGLEELPGVEDQIRTRLALLGEKYGVPPGDAEKALGHLLLVIWRAATDECIDNRRLDRARLLREFEHFTSVSVPKSTLGAISRLQSLVDDLRTELHNATAVRAAIPTRALSSAPPVPADFLHRANVCADISDHLGHGRRVILIGGRQSGKTSALSDYMADQRLDALWLDLSGDDEPARLLRQAAGELAQRHAYSAVVIDGLPSVDTRGDLAPALAIFLAQLESNEIPVLMSSLSEPAAPLQSVVSGTADDSYFLPAFSETEIADLLRQRGCPAQLLNPWTKVLSVTTAGEPLLVNVRVKAIDRAGYPKPTFDDVLQPPKELLTARKDLRLMAYRALQPNEIELLNRLSLVSHPYSRDFGVRLASAEPPLSNPGNIFDSLCGGWIQNAADDRFRTSSLAWNFGVEANGAQWAQSMHASISHAIVATDSITTTDVAAGLMHAFMSNEEAVALSLLSSMFDSSDDVWQAFANAADWLPAMWVGEAHRPINFADRTKALLRLAQIRVSLILHERILPELGAAFAVEYPVDSSERHALITRLLAVTDIVMRMRPQLDVHALMRYSLEWAELVPQFVPQDQLRELAVSLGHDDGDLDLVAVLGFLRCGKIKNIADLEALLDSIEPYGTAIATKYLSLLEVDRTRAHAFIDSTWIGYLESKHTPWSDVAAAFERIAARFSALGTTTLADSTAAVAVGVLTDFGSDPKVAFVTAERLEAIPGLAGGLDLESAIGHALFVDEQYSEAANRLAEVRERREWDGVDLYPGRDFRDAAIASARLGDWSSSANTLLQLANGLRSDPNALWKTAAYFDAAFALVKAGNIDGALHALREGASNLISLTIDPENTAQYMVLKRVGATTLWLAYSDIDTSMDPEPPPACATNLDTSLPEDEPKPPPTPIDAILANALRFEYISMRPDVLATRYEERLLSSTVPFVRASADMLAFFRNARAGGTASVVAMIARICAAVKVLTEQEASDAGYFLVLASFVPALRGTLDANVIAMWRSEAEKAGLEHTLGKTLHCMEGLFVRGDIAAVASMVAHDQNDQLIQVLGSLRYVSVNTPTIEGWLRVHQIWTLFLAQFPDAALSGTFLLGLITDQWRTFQERTILLTTPSVTAPALEAALGAAGTPWQRVRAILVAAAAAAGTTLVQPVRAAIEKRATK